MRKRWLFFLLFIVVVIVSLRAADRSFVGKWRLNPEKSVLHDQMKVSTAGANRYAFDFGGGAEFIVADGTDQPGLHGSTLAVTKEGPRTWRVVRKKDGRMEISAIWTLSPDGNTLHDDFTGYQPNGSTFNIKYVYGRIAGSPGFSNTWDSTSEKVERSEMVVQPCEGNGLSFSNLSKHATKLMKFDGKDYPVKDPNVPPGLMASARRADASTLEYTEKKDGKVADRQHIQLSADGGTLTMTIQPVSGRKPDVFVFDRE